MEQLTALTEKINETPPFVTVVVNVRLFLKWIKEETGRDGSARMQGDKVVLVPKTTDCFRTRVRVLSYIKTRKGMAFHTYGLPEELCTRVLMKGVGNSIPQQDVTEGLKNLLNPVQSVMQLHSQRRDADPAKTDSPHRTS